jgi:hypothetical protein
MVSAVPFDELTDFAAGGFLPLAASVSNAAAKLNEALFDRSSTVTGIVPVGL